MEQRLIDISYSVFHGSQMQQRLLSVLTSVAHFSQLAKWFAGERTLMGSLVMEQL
jgi:hypothetical protein